LVGLREVRGTSGLGGVAGGAPGLREILRNRARKGSAKDA